MALETIVEHILNDAKLERVRIIQEAGKEAERIIRQGKVDSDKIYQECLAKEKELCEKQKQKLIVSSHLEAKMSLLLAKQELIDAVFNKLKAGLDKTQLKKQQIGWDKVQEAYEDVDFYLKKIRPDYETKVSETLFV